LTDALATRLDHSYTLRVLEEMVRINSVVGQEGELARYLYDRLKELGIDGELHEIESDRPNVYGRLQGSGPGRRLHFNGHTDTVPVCEEWVTDPFTPVTKNGRLYGLGACDMKAGLACTLTLLKAFVESGHPFQGELSFSGVIDEEAYSKGAKAVLETDLAECDAIIIGEPYAGDEHKPIPLGITGKVLYDITLQGHAAHGFRPERGINAVEEAARLLVALDRLPMVEHPDFGTGSYCTLKIEGGYTVYSVVVPDRCRVEINRLLVPGETIDTAVAHMEALIESLDLAAKVQVGIKPPTYEPFLVSRTDPLMEIFHQVYHEVVGVEPLYAYHRGVTDANVFGELSIPCLHLGVPRGNVHQPNEFAPLDWLAPVCTMYALIAARYLTSG
jgi:acetylornithine deacetylase/succinyl-diaminopimelate desuccinylase-like protein